VGLRPAVVIRGIWKTRVVVKIWDGSLELIREASVWHATPAVTSRDVSPFVTLERCGWAGRADRSRRVQQHLPCLSPEGLFGSRRLYYARRLFFSSF
jgi:hypothetical protein